MAEPLYPPAVPTSLLTPILPPSYGSLCLDAAEAIPVYDALYILAKKKLVLVGDSATINTTKRECMDLALNYLHAWETDPLRRTDLDWAYGEARFYWVTLFSLNLFHPTTPLRHFAFDETGVSVCEFDDQRCFILWSDIRPKHPLCAKLCWYLGSHGLVDTTQDLLTFNYTSAMIDAIQFLDPSLLSPPPEATYLENEDNDPHTVETVELPCDAEDTIFVKEVLTRQRKKTTLIYRNTSQGTERTRRSKRLCEALKEGSSNSITPSLEHSASKGKRRAHNDRA